MYYRYVCDQLSFSWLTEFISFVLHSRCGALACSVLWSPLGLYIRGKQGGPATPALLSCSYSSSYLYYQVQFSLSIMLYTAFFSWFTWKIQGRCWFLLHLLPFKLVLSNSVSIVIIFYLVVLQKSIFLVCVKNTRWTSRIVY